jgi:hypothetical protein
LLIEIAEKVEIEAKAKEGFYNYSIPFLSLLRYDSLFSSGMQVFGTISRHPELVSGSRSSNQSL